MIPHLWALLPALGGLIDSLVDSVQILRANSEGAGKSRSMLDSSLIFYNLRRCLKRCEQTIARCLPVLKVLPDDVFEPLAIVGDA